MMKARMRQHITNGMQHVRARLTSTRGDTLAEVLVAMMIAVLATVLLATMVMTSLNVSATNERAQQQAYQAQSTMVQKEGTAIITLGDASETIDVKVFRSTDESGAVLFERYENANPRPDGA